MKSPKVAKDPRLQQVADTLAQLARGEFEARMMPSDRGDEIDAIIVGQKMLAEELRASFDALRRARDELEQRVKERTAELENANEKLAVLVSELETRNHEMTLLSEMGNLLQTSLTTAEAYAVIKQSCQELFPDWSGALYTYNASRNLLEANMIWREALSSEDAFTPEECRALRSGRVYRVEDTRAGLVCQHVERKAKATENNIPLPAGYMCVPMMAKGETTGILYLETARESKQLSARQPLTA
ncbi:MAG: hypothetical protein Q7T89_04545, partial [Anaerolineales bacterium]|nr:hypothetical protein [Anaerolineales bacterium]